MSKVGDALREAAAGLLAGAGGRLPIASLDKAVFYLELESLLKSGASITGATFFALPTGPVVATSGTRLVSTLENDGIAEQDAADYPLSSQLCLIRTPTRELLSETQWLDALAVGAWAATKTPSELSRLSRGNAGWQLAWQAGLGLKRPAVEIDLRIAMQQLLSRDPWLDQADPATEAACRDADLESGEKW